MMPETMELLSSTERRISKDMNEETLAHLGITEGILVYYNIISNQNHHNSSFLSTFAPNKSFS